MPPRKVATVAIAVVVAHFALTSIVEHYISGRVGAQAGEAVAHFLIGAHESAASGSADRVDDLYQEMRKSSKDITDRWLVPLAVVSFPAKFLLKPFLSAALRNDFESYHAQQLSRDEVHTRVVARDVLANLFNSLVLGALVYLVLRVFNRRNAP